MFNISCITNILHHNGAGINGSPVFLTWMSATHTRLLGTSAVLQEPPLRAHAPLSQPASYARRSNIPSRLELVCTDGNKLVLTLVPLFSLTAKNLQYTQNSKQNRHEFPGTIFISECNAAFNSGRGT
jgi:hypothetical protein